MKIRAVIFAALIAIASVPAVAFACSHFDGSTGGPIVYNLTSKEHQIACAANYLYWLRENEKQIDDALRDAEQKKASISEREELYERQQILTYRIQKADEWLTHLQFGED